MDSSDSSDDLPRAKLTSTASTANSMRADKYDTESNNSDKGANYKLTSDTKNTFSSDSDSTSSEDDEPSGRVTIKPELPDSESSDSDDDAEEKKLTSKNIFGTPLRRITPPIDSGSESSFSD